MSEKTFDMNAMLRRNFPEQKRAMDCEFSLTELILETVPANKNLKIARVIWDVCDASKGFFSADEVAGKIDALAEQGLVITFGNTSRWGYSEVTLSGKTSA